MLLLQFCLPKPKWNHTTFDIPKLVLACVRGRGLSLGHRKVDTKTKEAETDTDSVDYGFFGQLEDRAT